MDKIVLSREDIEFVLNWRDEHKDLVRKGTFPMRAVKIVCQDSGYSITAIKESNQVKFGVNQNGKSLGSVRFEKIEGGLMQIVRDKTKLSSDDKQSVLTLYCSLMAMLVYGYRENVPTEHQERVTIGDGKNKSHKSPKKKNRKGVTYIIKRSGTEPHLALKGSHASPSGSFSVRGHFRHYKSGKVVWIAEFEKGKGKKRDKLYKLGKRGNDNG